MFHSTAYFSPVGGTRCVTVVHACVSRLVAWPCVYRQAYCNTSWNVFMQSESIWKFNGRITLTFDLSNRKRRLRSYAQEVYLHSGRITANVEKETISVIMLRQFSCTLSLQYILTLAINMSDYKYYGVITFKLITNDLFDSLHCVNF